MNWDDAVEYALTFEGAELSTSYGQPAVKANGNRILNVGHERDTSFCLGLDRDLIEMLMETHPKTFWQTAHYAGHASVLVRYDSPDTELVREMIERSYRSAIARKPPRARKA